MKKLYSFTKNGMDFVILKDLSIFGWKILKFKKGEIWFLGNTPVANIFKEAERLSIEL